MLDGAARAMGEAQSVDLDFSSRRIPQNSMADNGRAWLHATRLEPGRGRRCPLPRAFRWMVCSSRIALAWFNRANTAAHQPKGGVANDIRTALRPAPIVARLSCAACGEDRALLEFFGSTWSRLFCGRRPPMMDCRTATRQPSRKWAGLAFWIEARSGIGRIVPNIPPARDRRFLRRCGSRKTRNRSLLSPRLAGLRQDHGPFHVVRLSGTPAQGGTDRRQYFDHYRPSALIGRNP